MSEKLKIRGSWVMQENLNATKRIVVNQGGARSGKTYSILLTFIVRAMQSQGNTYDVIRKTLPALRASAMKDFFDILLQYNFYDESKHNKSNMTYFLNGNEFCFYSLDDEQKVRGRKRDYCLLNEVNEIDYESYQQIMRRLSKQCFMDFNPSDPYLWVYDHVIPREDCHFIQSTYLDNVEFLPPSIVSEIERMRLQDENAWRVYGMGERGLPSELIYKNWEICKEWLSRFDETIYGLDFGYNNPTAMIEINFKDNDIYERQILHEREWTNEDLIKYFNRISFSKRATIYADCEDKNRIQELKRNGFYVIEADKSVKDGIDYCQRGRVYLHPDSTDLIREKQTYQWKQKNGMIMDEPVKYNDHLLDAERYARYTHFKLTRKINKLDSKNTFLYKTETQKKLGGFGNAGH